MKRKLVAFGIAVGSLTMTGQFIEAKTPASPIHAAEKSGQEELSPFRASLRFDRRDFIKDAMN